MLKPFSYILLDFSSFLCYYRLSPVLSTPLGHFGHQLPEGAVMKNNVRRAYQAVLAILNAIVLVWVSQSLNPSLFTTLTIVLGDVNILIALSLSVIIYADGPVPRI